MDNEKSYNVCVCVRACVCVCVCTKEISSELFRLCMLYNDLI